MYHEAVWVNLTLKFRLWTIENGFDSFVYENKNEGQGKDSYVTLLQKQISQATKKYTFNQQKYLDLVSPKIRDFMIKLGLNNGAQNTEGAISFEPHVFWAGEDPLQFWC